MGNCGMGMGMGMGMVGAEIAAMETMAAVDTMMACSMCGMMVSYTLLLNRYNGFNNFPLQEFFFSVLLLYHDR